MTGFQSADDVNLAGHVAADFTFTEVKKASGYSLGIQFDGILGLAWPSLSKQGAAPLMSALGIEGFSLSLRSEE